MRYILIFVLLLAIVSTASATVRRVGPSDSCHTIACAYSVTNPGDTILISSGSYVENLTIQRPVTILGQGIDATSNIGYFIFASGSGPSDIEGISFNYVNGSSAPSIRIQAPIPLTVRRCRFYSYPFAINQETSAPASPLTIEDCLFTPVTGFNVGSVSMNGNNVVIRNCIFAMAGCTGVLFGTPNQLIVQNCIFVSQTSLLNISSAAPFLFTNNIAYDWSGTPDWGLYPPASSWQYNASSGSAPQGDSARVLTANPFVNYNTTNNYVYGTSDLRLDSLAGGGNLCRDAGQPAIHDLDGSRSDLGIYGGQTPFIDSGAPNYPFVSSFSVPGAITVGQNLPIQSQGRIGRGY